MEWLDGNVVTFGVLMIAGGGAMGWRLWSLENFVKDRAKESREDRRLLYEKIQHQNEEIAELKGYLRGKGVINGHKEE